MYEAHPDFEPIGDNDRLWRYQDLPRYLDLLLRRQLFFNRIDRFEDPFEGTLADTPPEEKEQDLMVATINTWHLNEDENYAMWNIYARGENGLAIQTNFRRLKDALAGAPQAVYIGKVQYYHEHAGEELPNGSCVPYLCKRHIYRYENEVRCCYLVPRHGDEAKVGWEEQDSFNGVLIPVALQALIECIYISPYSPPWFRELVVRLNQHFKIAAPVRQSTVFCYEQIR